MPVGCLDPKTECGGPPVQTLAACSMEPRHTTFAPRRISPTRIWYNGSCPAIGNNTTPIRPSKSSSPRRCWCRWPAFCLPAVRSTSRAAPDVTPCTWRTWDGRSRRSIARKPRFGALRQGAAPGLAIDARVADLQAQEFAIEPAAYDLICDFYYLQRDLFPAIREGVRPGGAVAAAIHLTGAFALHSGELRAYFAGWKIVYYSEAREEGETRAAARIIARRA